MDKLTWEVILRAKEALNNNKVPEPYLFYFGDQYYTATEAGLDACVEKALENASS